MSFQTAAGGNALSWAQTNLNLTPEQQVVALPLHLDYYAIFTVLCHFSAAEHNVQPLCSSSNFSLALGPINTWNEVD